MNDCENTSQHLAMSCGVPGTNYFSCKNHIAKREHFAPTLDYQIMQKWLIFSTVWSQTSPKYPKNSKTMISTNVIALLLNESSKGRKNIFKE